MTNKSNKRLEGQIALVTGVSRRKGIGFAIASRLAQDGADLFIQSYSPYDESFPWGAEPNGIDSILTELKNHGHRVEHSNQIQDYKEVDLAFIELLGKKGSRLAYIPSQSDLQRKYFNQKVEWYKQFGITDLLYFDVNKEYDEKKIEELLACDAILLSGGNTYYFLNSLKKRAFLPKLREYVRTGGILIGVSAGSIIMSKTIDITTLHDENTISLKDYTALGLVDFEFFPHLDHNMKQYLEDLKKYSIKSNSVIYACKDGDGIIVNDYKINFFGEVLKIKNGEISRV